MFMNKVTGLISSDIAYMWNLKNGTNELILQNRTGVTDIENTLWLPGRKWGGGGKLRD